jgi:hypothetical protein
MLYGLPKNSWSKQLQVFFYRKITAPNCSRGFFIYYKTYRSWAGVILKWMNYFALCRPYFCIAYDLKKRKYWRMAKFSCHKISFNFFYQEWKLVLNISFILLTFILFFFLAAWKHFREANFIPIHWFLFILPH